VAVTVVPHMQVRISHGAQQTDRIKRREQRENLHWPPVSAPYCDTVKLLAANRNVCHGPGQQGSAVSTSRRRRKVFRWSESNLL
jgi:hypothetical protein